MGTHKGSQHAKKRKYLSVGERTAMVLRYQDAIAKGEPLTQAQLGEEFGVVQAIASRTLREAGVKTRSREEAWPTKVNPQEAARIYLENPKMTLAEVGLLYDVGWAAVRDQLKKLGIPFRESKDYPTYEGCNRQFFSELSPTTAYFAGFIAADGSIGSAGRSVTFGIHPKDLEIFNNLKKAASLDQPTVIRPIQNRIYAWLLVASIDWVRDLELHYNIVRAKSRILPPPNLVDEDLIWHFIRGYFDGDGHAKKNGGAINLITGSMVFFDWLVSFLGKPNTIQEHPWTDKKGETYISAKSGWWTGENMRRIVRRMYKNSKPETRLTRKYDRLKLHLVADAPIPEVTAEELVVPEDER